MEANKSCPYKLSYGTVFGMVVIEYYSCNVEFHGPHCFAVALNKTKITEAAC